MRTLISSLLLASSVTSYAATTPATTSSPVVTPTATTVAQPSIVEMETSVGTITVQLNWDKAPISSKNFLDYVSSGFYKNTFFHRVYSVPDPKDSTKTLIKIIQGGGFDAPTNTQKKTNATIVSEANNGLHNSIGSIAMARTSDPNSATSQFFFNLTDDSSSFDASSTSTGYAVFGTVIGGMDVVNQIGNYGTIKTAYSEGVPFSQIFDCGFNFCMKKIIIDTVYTSNVIDTINSLTRVTINGLGSVTSLTKDLNCTNSSSTTSKTCLVLKKPAGADISLIATPAKLYQFQGWSGDCSGTTTPLVLNTKRTDNTNINSKTNNNNCTATFTKIGA